MHGSDTNRGRLEASSPEQALGCLTDLVCRSLSVGHAVLWCRTPDDLIFESGPMSTPSASLHAGWQALCRQVQETNQPLVIDRGAAAPPSGDLASIDQAESISAFLGVPLHDRSGHVVGSLCAFELAPHPWSRDQIRILTDLGQTASAQMERLMPIASGEEPNHVRPGEIQGLIFERRKTATDSWSYRVFGTSRQMLSDVDEHPGHDQSLAFIHADDRERVGDSLKRAMAEEVDIDLTFRVPAAAGGVRWMRSQSVVRRDEDGTAVWDGLCYDVSDLVAARETAEAARAATDMLLIDVNHELRTPLQSILGFTELLKSESRPDVVRSHAALIETSAQSLLTIVNQLLDLASGKEVASCLVIREPLDVRALAETCHDMVAPLAAKRSIESSILVEADVPSCLLADGPKIRQVLVNLLNNAIKFTETGSIKLHVAYRKGRLRFAVTDTGIGIAEDKVGLLFQRFFRLEPAQRSTRGTGLGLAIAKQLVEAMGGEIGVSSAPARGATFWFELPAEALASPSAKPDAASEARLPAHGGTRILLADDLDLNRKLIADMLSIEDYEVDCVEDGEAALQAVAKHAYDLILMDMIMPGMDGLAATRAIRALPAPACDVPIIALTAHSFKEQLDSCIEAGMNATLTKPMSLDSLINTVKNWTRGRSEAA